MGMEKQDRTLEIAKVMTHGIVQVNLNGNKIAKATEDEMSKKIDFDFNNGDIGN